MKKSRLIYCLLMLSSMVMQAQSNEGFNGETITFTTEDKVEVTADLYLIADKKAPFILLCHQAGYSRGEYRPIAPILNKLGFNCMAIDQRSGNEVNDVKNETHVSADAQGKKTKYVNAIPDIEAALHYIKEEQKISDIIIWGSSYSASLTFYMASKYPEDIKGLIAFSPGEYMEIDGQMIDAFAAKVNCPVFVSSSRSEEDKWKEIYDATQGEQIFYLPETKGFHGSRALWDTKEGHEACWKAVEGFLMKFKG